MQRAAIYARYSTDEQRATSIEDQVRRAKEKALQLGFEVLDENIYSDSALTGEEADIFKRFGYQSLLLAWESGKFDSVVVDEVSRLARNHLEIAQLQSRIEKTNVRFVSTDGVDSIVPGWQLNFGFRGLMASHATRETAHRVIRAMIGQLERGFMIAAPPFGYRLQRDENDKGTTWVIDEAEAKLVEDMFARRRNGSAFAAIALSLNERGLVSPRPSRKSNTPRYWRAATVRQLLNNTIYRGVFIWHGSAFAKAKAKKRKKELSPIEYQRPALRIVPDEVWHDCNKPSSNRIIRGGGKSIFAGIVKCGTCDATLTVSSGGSTPSVYCAQCAQARQVGLENRRAYYSSVNGVKQVLLYAMEKLFSGEVIQEFRNRLRQRLEGGHSARIVELKREISMKERAISRYLSLLGGAEVDDPILIKSYKDAATEKSRLVNELKKVEAGLMEQDVASIERQLAVNPVNLLPRLFDGSLQSERVRVVIHQLFPVIQQVGKTGNFISHFHIEIAPGALLAELSNSKIVDEKGVVMKLSVVGGATRPTRWQVVETM